MRAHYWALFPRLLRPSQCKRRVRRRGRLEEARRRYWAYQLGATRSALYLWDTQPLPVIGYRRPQTRSDFVATAA